MGGASPGYGSTSPQSVSMIGTVPQGQPNSILRVIIENMIYPITIDVMGYIMFSMMTRSIELGCP